MGSVGMLRLELYWQMIVEEPKTEDVFDANAQETPFQRELSDGQASPQSQVEQGVDRKPDEPKATREELNSTASKKPSAKGKAKARTPKKRVSMTRNCLFPLPNV